MIGVGSGKMKQYSNILDKPLSKGKQEVSLSAFAFLFSELVQYNQTQVDNIAELERRLEDAGYAVGARVLELLCHREKILEGAVIDIVVLLRMLQGNRREIKLLGILSFVHSTVWKVADSLEKGTEHEDEYMISEKELLVNRFISIPKDMGTFNCGAFVAGIVKGVLDNAGFPAVVTAHFVPMEGQQRPRTTILIKFAEEKVQKALLQSDVQSKSDKSPVTIADYGSQALVSYVLQKELPSVPFSLVAEEDSGDLRKDGAQETVERITKLVNDTLASEGLGIYPSLSTEEVLNAIDTGISEGGPSGRHWVLDPIDGTKGGDQYAIALALLDEGKVVLGALACPNLPLASISGTDQSPSHGEVGCLFFAKIGGGTYMQSLDNNSPVKVQVSAIDEPEKASFFESYEAAHSSHDLSKSIAQKLGVKAPPVRIDSQAKYGALSRGDGAIYLRFPHKGYREKIWDHAAGCIVVTEAGGSVVDAAGKPLDFSQGRYLDLDTGILATNQKIMPSLLKAVKESIEEKLASL
ncbi:Ca(2+)-binding ATP:ADP antiporter sal1 [Turnera subulata]|uniref:Ca(2+)-binding ATP:ADP antiporter sal1 n=1 Tax=Turnera subulata TaxID=218843 RepID=A0A9Q0JH84_9ROSI|nr:Ca(2+)-binding ATP:ADP antiporter sal1 [Turnera subulata]